MNHKTIPWVNDKFILMIKQKRMLNVQRERDQTTINYKIFETNSSFHIKWRATEKFNFSFSRVFC